MPRTCAPALAALLALSASAQEPAQQPAAPPPAEGAAPSPAPAEQGGVPALLAAVDEDYRRRDEPGRIDDMRAKLDEAEKLAPRDYGVLWRQARLYFWLSDDPDLDNKEKSRLGKKAWESGDRASAVNPKGVEGFHYAAVGMGNYSLGIGIFSALGQGIEGKFKERLGKAEALDPTFEHGAIETAWGRFYYKLPWPKYDPGKSEQHLLKALKLNPQNVRAHVYLADLYESEHHPKEARAQLEAAVAHEPDRYDPAEEKRMQAVARKELARKK